MEYGKIFVNGQTYIRSRKKFSRICGNFAKICSCNNFLRLRYSFFRHVIVKKYICQGKDRPFPHFLRMLRAYANYNCSLHYPEVCTAHTSVIGNCNLWDSSPSIFKVSFIRDHISRYNFGKLILLGFYDNVFPYSFIKITIPQG